MTKQALNLFLNWAESHSKADQLILTVGIKCSKEKGEDIDEYVAKEIIKTVEQIIAKRSSK